MSTRVPPLFARIVDDAAVFPPGSAPLPEAVAGHRRHRAAWYADLVGPLLVPASALARLGTLLRPEERLDIGVVGDTGLNALPAAVESADPHLVLRQVEAPVAKRGEDPLPGLAQLREFGRGHPDLDVYAEIPLTWGLLGALDVVAEARSAGERISPKFRTGGLAAELFPTPMELAAVICACRDRGLPFKLTAGLHRAIRHHDPETGFTHHGFVNVLVATALAADDAEVAEVAALLDTGAPLPLIEPARRRLDVARPLWVGFGSCSIDEPLADLRQLGLLGEATDVPEIPEGAA